MKFFLSVICLLLSINLFSNSSLTNKEVFWENKGQVTGKDAKKVKYYLNDQNFTLFLMDNGLSYQFKKTHSPLSFQTADKFSDILNFKRNSTDEIRMETYRIDLELVGANLNSRVVSEEETLEKINFVGTKNISINSFKKVTYHNIYPNIDWVIYIKEGKVKYDFIVKPGGNPSLIKFKTHWAEGISLNKDGSFTLNCSMGSVREKAPICFQNNIVIASNYIVNKDIIQFQTAKYDATKTLIIDPALDWLSYYGGNGFGTVDEAAFGTTTDASGNVYIAGRTSATVNIASGGHQNSFSAGYDGFLAKFNSNGVRIWATYYGGANWDSGYSCATDAQGNVYLVGATAGSTGAIAFGGHQNTHGGGSNDAFLVKFNSNGVRIWATYYGGTGDDFANHCIVDNANNVYIAGATASTSSIASNGHQNTYGGGTYDPFLVKFDENGVRQWATYYGGNGGGVVDEIGFSCATDLNGNVYLAGRTNSTTGMAFNGHQNSWGGGYDGFLVKFNSTGTRLWATYYGGTNWDSGYSCATDSLGNIYLAGATAGSAGAIASGGHQNSYGGGTNDAYLVKFDGNGVRQWSTYYGGSADDYAAYCVTDISGNIYISGNSASSAGIAFGGHQNTYGGGNYDAFLARFNSNGTRLDATYLGSTGDERGHSCDIDASGNLYLCGQTSSNSIATGGHQNTYGGGTYDGYLAKFNVSFLVPTTISYSQSSYCQNSTNPTPTITGTSGGSFSAGAGLSINSSNGQINLAASTPGSYQVTYNYSGGNTTANVTITAQDTATLSYGANTSFCASQVNAVSPIISGVQTGTFSVLPSGLNINSTTGAITPSASTSGNYVVSYTTNGPCPRTVSSNITINAQDATTLSYGSNSSFCTGQSGIVNPVQTGVTTGTFSAATGLSINSTTGVITPSSSTPGNYTVTFTTSGSCPGTASVNIQILSAGNADFNYAASSFCSNATNPQPTINGITGGTFSANNGLSINSNSGVVNLSASTPGNYTIYYNVSGSCPASDSTTISIIQADAATISYTNANAFFDINIQDTVYGFNCVNPIPAPIILGTQGGSFATNGAGVYLNTTNGEILMPNSNLNFGPYLFTYTTTGNCPYIESFWVSSSCATTALTTLTDNFKIYPNPTFDGFINIETDLDMNTEIEIYNLIGAKVQTQSIKLIPGKNIIRLREDLAKADYLLFVNLGKEKRMFRISYR